MGKLGLNSGYIGSDQRTTTNGVVGYDKYYLERKDGRFFPVLEGDPDAQAFFQRVVTAGGTLSATEQTAIAVLVADLKTYGIWDKMKAIYPMVGASAAACAQNLKSSSFTGTFTSGWTFASTGVTPNGTSAYFDTGLNPTGIINENSVSISAYLRTNNDGLRCDIGASDSPNYQITLYPRLSDDLFTDLGSQATGRITYANTDSRGHFISTRTSSTSFKSFINSTLKATLTTTQTLSIVAKNIFLSANNSPSGITQYSNRQNAFSHIGDGLTDTEASNFYTAVQAFQTTLSRNV
jgi:hypothetical protein